MEWQISKCNLLGLPFEKSLSHAEYYIQQPLSSFVPLEQEPIEPDGNCFFRALSAVLQVRKVISQNLEVKYIGSLEFKALDLFHVICKSSLVNSHQQNIF